MLVQRLLPAGRLRWRAPGRPGYSRLTPSAADDEGRVQHALPQVRLRRTFSQVHERPEVLERTDDGILIEIGGVVTITCQGRSRPVVPPRKRGKYPESS